MKIKTSTKLKAGIALASVLTLVELANEMEYKAAFDPKSSFGKDKEPKDSVKKAIDAGITYILDQPHEKVEIVNDSNNKLRATFVPAKKESNKYVVLSHGYRNSGLREFGLMLPFYYAQNVNLLVVDHQAHGESEGTQITFGQKEHVDLEQWIRYLVARFGSSIQIYLHGISMGATTVLQTVNNIPSNVKGILADCGYANAQDQLVHTMKQNHVPFALPSYHLIHYKLKRRYNVDLSEISAKKVLRNTEVPIKIIHGDKDEVVPVENAFEIYNAIQSDNKELIIIPEAGHAQNYVTKRQLYESKIKEILEYE